jgi:hypothetical protein
LHPTDINPFVLHPHLPRDGKKYGEGKGLQVCADGKRIGIRAALGRLTAQLPKEQ